MTNTLFHHENQKMTNHCSFCAESGHNIRTCSDIRIENGWRDILRQAKIHEGPLDEGGLRNYLQNFPYPVSQAVAVQYANSHTQDLRYTLLDNICLAVRGEAARYETLSQEEKGAFRHWVDPSRYLPDGTVIPNDDDIIELEEDDFIPFNDVTPIFNNLIEARLLCTESEAELAAQCECPICFEEDITLSDMNTTSCEHSFCHSCIMKHLRTKNNCPMCRTQVTTLQVRYIEHYDAVKDAFGPITRNSRFHIFQTPIGTFESSPPLPASILRRLQPIHLPSVERLRRG
jgi:hypothetical protein